MRSCRDRRMSTRRSRPRSAPARGPPLCHDGRRPPGGDPHAPSAEAARRDSFSGDRQHGWCSAASPRHHPGWGGRRSRSPVEVAPFRDASGPLLDVRCRYSMFPFGGRPSPRRAPCLHASPAPTQSHRHSRAPHRSDSGCPRSPSAGRMPPLSLRSTPGRSAPNSSPPRRASTSMLRSVPRHP